MAINNLFKKFDISKRFGFGDPVGLPALLKPKIPPIAPITPTGGTTQTTQPTQISQPTQSRQQILNTVAQQLKAIKEEAIRLGPPTPTQPQTPTPPLTPTPPVAPTPPTPPIDPTTLVGQQTPEQTEIQGLKDTLASLQQQITKSVAPTQEEIDLQKQLSNLIASKELGVQKVAEQPIATPFITGQQKAITARAGIQALPLQAKLSALQAQRKAAFDISETQLGFEEAKLERAEEAAEPPDPFTLTPGQQRFELNPETGQFEPIAKVAPTTARGTLTEVGGRRLLIDPTTGVTIADLGEATGSLSDQLSKFLTVTEADKLGLPVGTTFGEAVGTVPLKAKEAKDEAQAKLSTIDRLIELLEGGEISTGPLEESRRVIAERTGAFTQSQAQQDFNAMIAKVKAGALFDVGGKALTDAEIAILSPFLPDLGKQESVNLTNLRLLKTEATKIFEQFTQETTEGTAEYIDNGDGTFTRVK